MKYNLVVFDMDGTIINTLDDLTDSCNFVLKNHNFPLHTNEEIKQMVGNGIPKLVQRAAPSDICKTEFEVLLDEFMKYYSKHCDDKTRSYDGIIDCLKALKKAGIKTAVNTNKEEQTAINLCNKIFPSLFDYVCGFKTGMNVKPSPDGIYEIVEKIGIQKPIQNQPIKNVCYVGDSDVDFQTAKNSMVDFIGVDWGFRGEAFLRQIGAKNVVKNTDELLKALI